MKLKPCFLTLGIVPLCVGFLAYQFVEVVKCENVNSRFGRLGKLLKASDQALGFLKL